MKDDIEIGLQVRWGPALPVGLRYHAGHLAKDIFPARKLANVLSPGFEFTVTNARFGNMVQNEYLRRMAIYEGDGCRKVTLKDENIVDEAELLEQRNTRVKVRPLHEVIVRFILNHVAEPLQFFRLLQALNNRGELRAGNGRPTHDSTNKVKVVGEAQQPRCLLKGLPCLDGDAAMNSRNQKFSPQIFGKKIPCQHAHALSNPAVLLFRVTPEVMVSINSLEHCP